MIYVIATGMSMLLAYISTHIVYSRQLKSQHKQIISKVFAFLSFLPLTVISAVRYDVGTDFMNYWRWYQIQFSRTNEPGFKLFARLLHIISDNPQIFFIASSIFIYALHYLVIYRESSSPVYSIFLFFVSSSCYFSSLNLVRQHMATGVLLYALSMYRSKKYKQAVILTLISATIHNSAILVAIALVGLDIIKLKPLNGAIVIIAASVATNIFSMFFRGVIAKYTTYGMYVNETEANTYISIVLVFLCFFILLSYIYDKVKSVDTIRIMFSSVQAGLIVGTSVATLFTPANRMMYYVEAVLMLYVPEAIKNIDRKYVKYSMYALVTAAYIIRIIWFYNGVTYKDDLQYQSIWSY